MVARIIGAKITLVGNIIAFLEAPLIKVLFPFTQLLQESARAREKRRECRFGEGGAVAPATRTGK